MTYTTRIARLILAGTTATLMLQTPAFAENFAQTAYDDMYKNITTGLEAILVPTTELNQLTAAQLRELAMILDTTQSNSDKKMAAETVIRDSLHPRTVNMNSPEAMQMIDQLKVQLTSVGLAYPTNRALTFDEVLQLMDIFAEPGPSDAKNAGLILSNITNHVEESMSNEGAIQMQAQAEADMSRVGVVVPASMVLTFDQVIGLTAIFNRDTTDTNKAFAAKTLLGLM